MMQKATLLFLARRHPTVAGAMAACVLTLATISNSAVAQTLEAPIAIEARPKSDQAWQTYHAGTIDHLTGYAPPEEPTARSRFGGRLDQRRDGTGFFRVEKIDERWLFVDPLGHPYVSVGLTSVRPPRDEPVLSLYREYYRSDRAWAQETTAMARALGFNGLGRWSHLESLRAVADPLPYTTSYTFMADFARGLGLTHAKYGHTGYRERVIPVFHPDFEAFCDDYAQRLTEIANDPYVLGHFSDNELPMVRDLLSRTLTLEPDDPELRWNREEAWRWLRARYGGHAKVEQVTDEDNLDFLGHVMDRYYEVTTRALRKHAPNHLCLGSRLHGAGPKIPQVLAAAGRHLDVVSINYYNVWEPREEQMAMWAEASAAPVLITEFYIKGDDTGMENDRGAGWIVGTQAERGIWYQNFTLRLLANGHCVGWQYFKYQDTPGDSNKGILSSRFDPYSDMIAFMRDLNRQAYALIDHFDAGP